MKVWIVYLEQQSGEPEIQGIFAAEAGAKKCRAESIDEWKRMGQAIYPREDDEEGADGFEDIEWDVDVHIEDHEVEP